VFLWAVLPPAAVVLLEKMFFNSEHAAEFVARRLGGFAERMHVDSDNFEKLAGDVRMPSVSDAFDAFQVSGVFTSPELWIGLLGGAALIAASIRIRRYRDES
jgi:hypothetical protein